MPKVFSFFKSSASPVDQCSCFRQNSTFGLRRKQKTKTWKFDLLWRNSQFHKAIDTNVWRAPRPTRCDCNLNGKSNQISPMTASSTSPGEPTWQRTVSLRSKPHLSVQRFVRSIFFFCISALLRPPFPSRSAPTKHLAVMLAPYLVCNYVCQQVFPGTRKPTIQPWADSNTTTAKPYS